MAAVFAGRLAAGKTSNPALQTRTFQPQEIKAGPAKNDLVVIMLDFVLRRTAELI
jgi:hypothetical protein